MPQKRVRAKEHDKENHVQSRVPHVCWRCWRNGYADPLDKHHIFGGVLRKKSEQYELVVYLCNNGCHENGPETAYWNPETMQQLHEYGRRKTTGSRKTLSGSSEEIICEGNTL